MGIMAELELASASCTVMMSKARLGLDFLSCKPQEVTLSFERSSNGIVRCRGETTKEGGHYGTPYKNIAAQEDVEFGWSALETIDSLKEGHPNKENGTIRLCRQGGGFFSMPKLDRHIHFEGTDKVALANALKWINAQESGPLKSMSHRGLVHREVLAYLSGSPAVQVFQRRRLADAARMEAKDVAAMSPSELSCIGVGWLTASASRPSSLLLWMRSSRPSATTCKLSTTPSLKRLTLHDDCKSHSS